MRTNYAAILMALTCGLDLDVTSGFVGPIRSTVTSHVIATGSRHFREGPTAIVRYATLDDESDEQEESPFTALPPVGASSFWDRPSQDGDDDDGTSSSSANENSRANAGKISQNNRIIVSDKASLVSKKFKIQYTCKVCDTRNSHSVSRLAYRKGLVVAMCKGCESRHLIADNLGWTNHIGGFDFDNGETNIEKYMANREGVDDEVNDLVMRVGRDVFDLENILYNGKDANNPVSSQAAEDDQSGEESNWD